MKKVTLEDFPDYDIRSDGRVFRVRGRRLKIQLTDRNKIRQHLWVHRIVCRAFHREPPVYNDKEAIVRHLDNDPTNNSADNLRWGTQEENEADKKRFYGGW